jgi:hypothetical protein
VVVRSGCEPRASSGVEEGECGLDLAEIFRLHGDSYRHSHSLSRPQLRAMRAIEICRTAALGGHLYECEDCGKEKICYNSCRNRHCPRCQSLDRQRWLEERSAELLPVPYFHIVFTLPEELNPLVLINPRLIYTLLFDSASQTLLEIAADPKHLGARIGILAVLHTWGQTLQLHPHLHCIVPGGGLSPDRKKWIGSRPRFFLPVAVLSRLFRGKFLAGLKAAHQAGELKLPESLSAPFAFKALLDELYGKAFVVYSKPPFGSAEKVLGYLARYTHRVAISNSRLVRLADGQVTFTYKDYSDGDKVKEMTLPVEEFLRRFLLHILPERFVRIRYYGLLSTRTREEDLALCRQLLGVAKEPTTGEDVTVESWRELLSRLTGKDPTLCPHCERGHLRWVKELAASPYGGGAQRPPP